MQCLTKYLIQTADGPAYRSGNLDGMRHPAVDGKMIRAAGGMKKLLEGADELETDRSDPDGTKESGSGYRADPLSGQRGAGALPARRCGRSQGKAAEMDPYCRKVGRRSRRNLP